MNVFFLEGYMSMNVVFEMIDFVIKKELMVQFVTRLSIISVKIILIKRKKKMVITSTRDTFEPILMTFLI